MVSFQNPEKCRLPFVTSQQCCVIPSDPLSSQCHHVCIMGSKFLVTGQTRHRASTQKHNPLFLEPETGKNGSSLVQSGIAHVLTCLQGNQEGEDKRINTLVSVNLAQQTEAWSLSLLPTLPPRPDWALYLKQCSVFGNYNNKTLPKKVTGFFFFLIKRQIPLANYKTNRHCRMPKVLEIYPHSL